MFFMVAVCEAVTLTTVTRSSVGSNPNSHPIQEVPRDCGLLHIEKAMSCESGGTGRRTGLRIQRATVGVQLPPLAPTNRPSMDQPTGKPLSFSCFFLIFT